MLKLIIKLELNEEQKKDENFHLTLEAALRDALGSGCTLISFDPWPKEEEERKPLIDMRDETCGEWQ